MQNKTTQGLLLALMISALAHFVVIFYETEEKNSAIDSDDSIVVSVELVSGNDKPFADINDRHDQIEQKQSGHKKIIPIVSSKSDKVLKTEQVQETLSQPVVSTGAAKQQDVAKSSQHQADEFLKLVYIEISKNKHYPYQARRQRREGRVTVNFKLHPDGHVSEVLVMESSRFNVLDRAAKQAVEAISPFAMAANYLNVETEFNVDIDYRLN